MWMRKSVLGLALATMLQAASAQVGGLDPGFGAGGVVTKSGLSGGSFLVALADGAHMLGGYARNGSTGNLVLHRFLSNGAVDTNFGSNGVALNFSFNVNAPPTFEDALELPDGKLLVVGGRFIGERSLQLHRINADGSVDLSFLATDPAPGKFCYGTRLHRLDDGRLLVAALLDRGANPGADTNFAVLRYAADGQLDASFGVSGIAEVSITNGQDRPFAMLVQTDGAIVLGGFAPLGSGNFSGFAIARFSAEGQLDLSFSTDGIAMPFVASSTEFGQALALQPDGKILFAGNTSTNGGSSAIVRLEADGALDSSFGNGGRVVWRNGFRSEVRSLALADDGAIYAGGIAIDADDSTHMALARVSALGVWDSSFGLSGRVSAPFNGAVMTRQLLASPQRYVVGGTWANVDGIPGVGLIGVSVLAEPLMQDGFESPSP